VDQALGWADVTHLGARRYPELSGGEQQRVQFARVLVQCKAARWCDRLLLLCGGRAIAAGTPAEVLTPKNLYLAYGIDAHVMPHPVQPERLLVVTT